MAYTARVVGHCHGALLADQKYAPLVPAQELTKLSIVITRLALEGTFDPPPQHCHTTQHIWLLVYSRDGACGHVQESGSHEILAIAVAHAACKDALLARSHWTKMDKTQFRLIPAARNPPIHPAAMTVNPIPHHLEHKPTNSLQTRNPVELGHAKRHVVTVPLLNQASIFLDVGFAAASRDARIGGHLFNEYFEVARRQAQIEVQLAQIVIIVGTYGVVSSVKCFNDARAD